MSYYTNRRYSPPADVYRASTLIGQHTGKNVWTPLAQNPALDADLQQFRSAQTLDDLPHAGASCTGV